MANKTITQLPLQTGITDNDLLAIVDSGETTTSKIKVSTLLSAAGGGGGKFIDAGGFNSIANNYYSSTNIGSGSEYSQLLGGSGNTITTDPNFTQIIGGYDNDISGNSSRPVNTILGSYSSNISSNLGGFGCTIIGGHDHLLDRATESSILGGNTNTVNDNNSWASAIVGGQGNYCAGGQSGVFAGQSNNQQGQRSVILGGESNLQTSAGDWSGILGGNSNTVSSTRSAIIGGLNNNVSGLESVVVGGNQNDCLGPVSGVFAGAGNDITGGQFCAILAGNVNDINSNAAFSCIIGGTANVTDHYRSVVVGGTGLSTAQNDEVVVPDLRFPNYASMNFANDTAAAAAGVLLGQVYHNAGDLRIRITW